MKSHRLCNACMWNLSWQTFGGRQSSCSKFEENRPKLWSFSTKSHRIYINASFQISKALNFIQHHNSTGRRCETFLTNVHGLNFFNPNCLNTHSGIFNKWRSAVTGLHLNFWDYKLWTVYRKDPVWVLNSGIYIINKFICKLRYLFVSKI